MWRNYYLYSILADVRQDNHNPIECVTGEPLGLPEDVSPIVKKFSDDYGVDGHSHTYLDICDIEKVKQIWDNLDDGVGTFPQQLLDLKKLKEVPVIEDVRVIIWFDN